MSAALKTRLSIEMAMTILMLLAMAYQLTGNLMHEVLGMALLGLFALHHWLNRRWFAALVKGRYTARRSLNTIVDFLLMVAMFLMMVTGILLSRDLFPVFPYTDDFLMRRLHTFSANWGFILMSAHLGLHWGALMGAVRKMTGTPVGNRAARWTLRVLTLAIIAWGVRSFFALALEPKLTLYDAFGYWNFKKDASGFFLAYLSVMGVFSALTYHAVKLLGSKNLYCIRRIRGDRNIKGKE